MKMCKRLQQQVDSVGPPSHKGGVAIFLVVVDADKTYGHGRTKDFTGSAGADWGGVAMIYGDF